MVVIFESAAFGRLDENAELLAKPYSIQTLRHVMQRAEKHYAVDATAPGQLRGIAKCFPVLKTGIRRGSAKLP